MRHANTVLTGTILPCNDQDRELLRTLHAWIADGHQEMPLYRKFVQVKGKLKAMLHSGQQSFTNASRFRVAHADGGSRKCDKTMAEALIPIKETPLDPSDINTHVSSVDPDPGGMLRGVPLGCAHSRDFSCCAQLDSQMLAHFIWLHKYRSPLHV